jgi:hypothetical protein
MAKIVSAVKNAQGQVVVTYDDQTNVILTPDQAKKKGIKVTAPSGPTGGAGPTGGTGATGGTGGTGPGSYGNVSGAFTDTNTGLQLSGTVTWDGKPTDIASAIYAANNVKTLGKIRSLLLNNAQITADNAKDDKAVKKRWQDLVVAAATSGEANPDVTKYIQSLKGQGFVQTTAAAATPTPYSQITVYTPEKAQALVIKQYNDLLHRDPNAEELTTAVDDLIKQQQKSSSASKTTYKKVGGSTQSTTVTGFDEAQYLSNKITGTPEYKKTQEELNSVAVQQLKKIAADNGVPISDQQLVDWSKRLAGGENADVFKTAIRGIAKMGQPDSVKNLLDQGVDLNTIYQPYKQSMATTLEINPSTITLDDPTLRAAIGPDKEMTLYDYQRALRKDPRWQYTNNARSEAADVATQVLKDFGFMG